MNSLQITVVIPTRNRHEKLARTVASLAEQSLPAERYEIIVVDDGSTPPVRLDQPTHGPRVTVVRLEGVERSLARNAGADRARGELLVFVDNDMEVRPSFLADYWQAYQEWPDGILVGAIRLASPGPLPPFLQFRQSLEQCGIPQARGPVTLRNLCAAGNMAIARARFLALGGFARQLSSGEDQDLALRHTAAGGVIAYIPEAEAIHHDSALDIRSYCRRTEWGAEQMQPFRQRWSDWPDNMERQRINGPVAWGSEPLRQSLRKCLKRLLSVRPATDCLFALTFLLERTWPNPRVLDPLYRLLLGIHLLRGYRRGLDAISKGGTDSPVRPNEQSEMPVPPGLETAF